MSHFPVVSPGGAILALLRLGARRWLNRVSAVFVRRKKKGAEGKRTATPRKTRRSLGLVLLIGVLFAAQSAGMTLGFLANLGREVEKEVREPRAEGAKKDELPIRVSRDTWTRLETQDFLLEKSTGELREYDLKIAKEALENERSLVASEGREPPFDVARALKVFEEHGIDGFEAEPFPSEGRNPIIFGRPVWPDGGGRDVMSLSVGWIVLLLWASLLLLSLGAANQDLGKVDWSVEWLFTLPAPAWVIFLARMVEASILNAMGWVIMMPFFSVVYWTAGFGAWGIGLAFLAALSFVTLLAAARILIETWLRTRLAFGALKNAQAAASMAGLLVWFGVFWLVFSPGALGHVAALSASTHDAFLWTPWTIAAVPARLDATAFAAFPAMLLSSALLALAAVKLCERCARHGLIANSGSRRGVRRKDAAQAATRTRSTSRESRLFGGILGKDLKLLLRDRNFFAQTLIVPLVIIGFQVVFNPTILEGAVKDPRHASVLAFGVGAYILCFSGFQILVAEGPALWMLYTLPHDLWRLLLRKAMLWCWLALGYATVVLGLAAGANLEMGADGLATIGVAIAGVLIHAFIAAGLGVLGTDPLEAEQHRRVDPTVLQSYMLIAATYAHAVYTPFVWPKIVHMALSALLAVALWQKVRERLPFLLDPTALPPPRIALSDGLIAVLVFFVIQGVLMTIPALAGIPPTLFMLLVAFVVAGALTAPGSFYVLWRRKVPRIFASVGLRGGEVGLAPAISLGLLAGALSGGLGYVYLLAVEQIEWLGFLTEGTSEALFDADESRLWLVLLAVVAAPIFEEVIFRGLVYTGLRNSMRPVLAIFVSAVLFAIVHPLASVVPVFVLGIACAWLFERTRVLYAAMAAHAAYNAIVVGLA